MLLTTISTTLYAQDGIIRLSECIHLALENKANMFVPECRKLLIVKTIDLLAINIDLAFTGPIECT